MKKIILLIIFFLCSQVHVLAASFDCAKATRQLDIQICESPVLSELDTEMAMLYEKSRSTSAYPNEMRSEQRQWLAKRDRCQDSVCLRQEYEQRIRQLRQPQTSAQEVLQIPTFTADVVDQASILDEAQRSALETRLAKIKQREDTHMVVLIVESTASEDIDSFANRVANTWNIGHTTKTGKGVLIVVAKQDRRMRIEIAQSLKDAISDSAAARIIEQTIRPKFRENDFAGGLSAAIDQLGHLVAEARLATNTQEEEKATELKKIEAKKQRAEKKRLRLEREQLEAEEERTDLLKNIAMWLGGALTLTALVAVSMFRREILSLKLFLFMNNKYYSFGGINNSKHNLLSTNKLKISAVISRMPINSALRKIIVIIFSGIIFAFIIINILSKAILLSTDNEEILNPPFHLSCSTSGNLPLAWESGINMNFLEKKSMTLINPAIDLTVFHWKWYAKGKSTVLESVAITETSGAIVLDSGAKWTIDKFIGYKKDGKGERFVKFRLVTESGKTRNYFCFHATN